jgi:hypothetical protein
MKQRYWITKSQIDKIRNTTFDGGEATVNRIINNQVISLNRGVLESEKK